MDIARATLQSFTGKMLTGWLPMLTKFGAPETVTLVFGDTPIHVVETSIDAGGDDGQKEGQHIFRFDLGLIDVRSVLRQCLNLIVGASQRSPRSDLDVHIELKIIIGGLYYSLSSEKETRKSAHAWIEFFDFDISGDGLVDAADLENMQVDDHAVKAIAFYLPQYYPFKQNNEWWGPGFTEWAGVATAQMQYAGHKVPNVPADLGFYDLRLKDVRRQQGELAKAYGIFGFCYYFYWFDGKRLMEEGLDLILKDREPDIPFCLCWANETWSRRWDGSESEVLIQQRHDTEGDLRILSDLMPFFNDQRYIKIDGKPLLLIYRPALMPDAAKYVRRLKEQATELGLPGLYVCNMTTFGDLDSAPFGCDAIIEFPPHIGDGGANNALKLPVAQNFKGTIYSYPNVVGASLKAPEPGHYSIPGIMPRWDNTARKSNNATIFHGSTPELFEVWARHAVRRARTRPEGQRLLFVNSWNEWGEGAHLEPDRATGRSYLTALQRALSDTMPSTFSIAPEFMDLVEKHEILNFMNTLIWENEVLKSVRGRDDAFAQRIKVRVGIITLDNCELGLCHIEWWNGLNPDRDLMLLQNGRFSIRGWSHPAVDIRPNYDRIAYLLLQGAYTKKSYYTPICSWQERQDVKEHCQGGLEGESYYGFSIDIADFDLVTDDYSIHLIEVGEHRYSVAPAQYRVRVQN
jgi:Glycosyltransferase WbsX